LSRAGNNRRGYRVGQTFFQRKKDSEMKKQKATELIRRISAALETTKGLTKMLKQVRETLELARITLQNDLGRRGLSRAKQQDIERRLSRLAAPRRAK